MVGAAVLAACAPAVTPQRAGEPSGAGRAPSNSAFMDGPARRVRSRTLEIPIELELPNKDAWRVSDGPNWLSATHSASASLVAVKTWRAERLVRRTECEAQARLERPSLPIVREEAVLERRALTAPAGFDTQLVVGVEPSARGIRGYALAIGASVGRCYAAVFSTEVSGANGDPEQEVATRLGSAVDRILSRVRVRSVDERAVRRRLVSTPSAGTPHNASAPAATTKPAPQEQ